MMVVLLVILAFCLYVGVSIWWLFATANGLSTPVHMHQILNYPVTDHTMNLLLETMRVLVGGLFFYAVTDYVIHKSIKRKKRKDVG